MSQVRIVCFDWGGVILRHCRSWQEGCAAAGLPVHPEVLTPDHTQRRRALTQAFQRGHLSPTDFFDQLAAINNGQYTREELVRIHDAWLLDEYPGVHQVLEALVQVPTIETALLSNTNHDHWVRHLPGPGGKAPDYPAAALLKHRHASHLLGLAKPDAAIYQEFERLVGARGGEVLFFDDLKENIDAAAALGWQCVHIDHTTDTAAQIRRGVAGAGIPLPE